MKKLIVVLFLTGISYAQNTVVSATIVDASGQAYAFGSWKVDFFPTPGVPGPYTQQGTPFTQHFSGILSSNGSFTVTLASSASIVPAKSQWTFTVCPDATFQCTTTTQTVNGSTLDMSANISNFLPPSLANINPNPNFTTAYQNLNMGPPERLKDGSSYFNTTTGLPCWFYHGVWECLSGGGSGGGLQAIIGTGAATATNNGATATVNVPIGVDVFRYTGLDICVRINAAMLANPGINLIAQGFTGVQTCSINPFTGSAADVVLYLGNVTINTTVPWVTNSGYNALIYGIGRGSKNTSNNVERGTNIVAANGFPATCDGLANGCPILRLGDGTAPAFGHRIENLTLDCNGQPGVIGWYSSDIQEQSGARHFQVLNCSNIGVLVDGSSNTGGSGPFWAQNYEISDGEIYALGFGTTSTVGMRLIGGNDVAGGQTAPRMVYDITSSGTASAPIATAYQFEQFWGGELIGLNAENAATGYQFGIAKPMNGTTASNLRCANVTAICVWVTANAPFTNNLVLTGIQNTPTIATYTIKDDMLHMNILGTTDPTVGLHIIGNGYPNGGSTFLSTSSSVGGAELNVLTLNNNQDASEVLNVSAGRSNDETKSVVFQDRGTNKWSFQATASDQFLIFDHTVNKARLWFNPSDGQAYLNSHGSGHVSINKEVNDGTGGLEVCSGGPTPTCNFFVNSVGQISAQGQGGFNGEIPVSSTCALIVTSGLITGHFGTGCP